MVTLLVMKALCSVWPAVHCQRTKGPNRNYALFPWLLQALSESSTVYQNSSACAVLRRDFWKSANITGNTCYNPVICQSQLSQRFKHHLIDYICLIIPCDFNRVHKKTEKGGRLVRRHDNVTWQKGIHCTPALMQHNGNGFVVMKPWGSRSINWLNRGTLLSRPK